ncbi:MAG: hypothetical protein COZ08_05370, partial [Bacteroidetes bacterium CG_4_10_14_3_um_filter_42_6]
MVYNNEPGHQYIFTLTPKLKLMVINTNPPYNTWTTSLNMSMSAESWLDEVLQSQNGRVLLKYDNTVTNYNHHRLYVLVGGRDQISNETGNFHQKTHFFGIYNIDYNMLPGTPGYANLIYTETNIPGDYYGNQINNYVFNQQNNYLYLIRLGINGSDPAGSKAIIDIKEVGATSVSDNSIIEFDNPGGSNWFKMGKVLYINENGLNKIVILPYRYFMGVVNNPRFCVIDGNTNQAKFVACPSKRITDAVFLGQNNDLVLSYAPNNDEIFDPQYENSNIAVLRYNPSTLIFDPLQHFDNDNSISTSAFDLNVPFNLTMVNNSTAMIIKKDGVAKLQYVNGTYVYSPPLLSAEGNSFGNGVVAGAKTFVTNPVANGLEVFNNNTYTHVESIRT